MADTKISGLTPAASAQGSDQIPINRSGINFSLTAAQIAALTDISGKVDKTTTVNGHALSANVTVTASDVGALPTGTTTASVPDSTNKRYVTDAELAVLAVTSGTNTGDQNLFNSIIVATQPTITTNSTTTALTLAAGTNVTITTDNTTKTATINASGSGGGAPSTAQYLTLATDPGLSAERVLQFGSAFNAVDNGPNSSFQVDLSPTATGNYLANLTGSTGQPIYTPATTVAANLGPLLVPAYYQSTQWYGSIGGGGGPNSFAANTIWFADIVLLASIISPVATTIGVKVTSGSSANSAAAIYSVIGNRPNALLRQSANTAVGINNKQLWILTSPISLANLQGCCLAFWSDTAITMTLYGAANAPALLGQADVNFADLQGINLLGWRQSLTYTGTFPSTASSLVAVTTTGVPQLMWQQQ